LEQSVDLIEYGILKGESGDTIIPKLISLKVKDLIEIFADKYNKPIKTIGIKPGEKLCESLINLSQSARICKKEDYIHIKSGFDFSLNYNNEGINYTNLTDYNSTINPLTKNELYEYLQKLNLL